MLTMPINNFAKCSSGNACILAISNESCIEEIQALQSVSVVIHQAKKERNG